MRFCVAFAEMAAKQKEGGRASGRHLAEGHEYSNGMNARADAGAGSAKYVVRIQIARTNSMATYSRGES